MTLRSLALLSILCAGSAVLGAQTPPQVPSEPLVKQDFKDGDGGWKTFGPTASVSVSHETPVVAPGDGALKFGYTVKKGDINALVFPVQVGTLTRAKSLKFRVHTDAQTVMAVMLQEQDGGRYIAICMAPKNSWQPVELSTDDFWLSDGPNDPKDPDGKLDMDKVNAIVVTDLAQMFEQSDDEALKSIFGIQPGDHSLYLDDFSVSSNEVQTVVSSKGSDIVLETFSHPQLAWFPLGGGDLVRATDGPSAGTWLKDSYRQSPGKFALISHAIPAGTLSGARSLSVDVASQQPARLIVQIEQTDGGKYQFPIDLEGGPMPKHSVLSFDSFTPSGDSRIPSGKPDMAKVKTIMILDASGILSQADHDNVLWVAGLVAHK